MPLRAGPMPAEAFDVETLRRGAALPPDRRTVSRPGESAIPSGTVGRSIGRAVGSRAQRPDPSDPGPDRRDLPDPFLDGLGGGGAGGGGGGGSAGGGAVTAGFGTIDQARAAVAAQRDSLLGDYEDAKNELRAEFQFAETDAERESLAQMLAELNRHRDEGLAAIAQGFEAAQADVLARQEAMATRAPQRAQEVGDLYRQTAGDIAGSGERAAELAGRSGIGVNVGGRGIGAVDDLAAGAMAAGAREQTLEGRLGDIRTEDLAWLADNIARESEGTQAGFRGQAMGLGAGMMGDHAERVGGRIQREQDQWRQMLAGLQGDFRQRGFQLDDADVGLLSQLAQMQQSSAESAASRRAAASRGGGGGGGGVTPQQRMAFFAAAGDLGPEFASALASDFGVNPDFVGGALENQRAEFEARQRQQQQQDQDLLRNLLGP